MRPGIKRKWSEFKGDRLWTSGCKGLKECTHIEEVEYAIAGKVGK